MEVCAVVYHPDEFSNELYDHALATLDPASQTRIKRFYHRVDACRTLIGRLLVRVALQERGIDLSKITFDTTPHGKPYISPQSLDPPFAYNVTHDNNLVAIVLGPGRQNSPAFTLGIDVMKIKIPGRESLDSFIHVVGDQVRQPPAMLLDRLTNARLLGPVDPARACSPLSRRPDSERLKRFFWMWTLKEAYTKALGLGLGFDFKRVEFDPVEKTVKVDGKEPQGWKFTMFVVPDGDDFYQGVVAEYLGEGVTTELIPENAVHDWLKVLKAVSFTEMAIQLLNRPK